MSESTKVDSDKDGRAARAKRSRQKIIEATLDLYTDGIYVPTAQLVADRSGLGIRTVFRHFSEMEQLFIEGDKMLHARFAALPKVTPVGDLENRLSQLIDLRMDNCERFAPFIRAAQAQMWRYKELRKNYRKIVKIQRQRLFEFLPELETFDPVTQDAAEIAISFELWNRLRHTQKKSRAATKQIMHKTLASLL